MRDGVLRVSWLLVVACGPGPSGGDTDTTSTTATTTGDVVSAADAGTSGTSAETPTDAGPTTTGESSTGTTDASSTGEPVCVRETEWESKHLDCVLDWPTMTAVEGVGPAASLGVVDRLFFGVFGHVCIDGLMVETLIVGDPKLPDAEMWFDGACGPEGWPGVYDIVGRLADDTEFVTTLTVEGYAGDWLSPEPVDPPRLRGSFSGDLVGAFEAVHCADLDLWIGNCG